MAYQSFTPENVKGLCLALSSCIFIGSSFIMKKLGLKKAGALGLSADSGGYSYLLEPFWWTGMLTMMIGEVANFAAYAYAPAILVTPLGAVSIIVSAILAHIFLDEKLHALGVLGCILSIIGSATIVLHAPQDKNIVSVEEIWELATESAFMIYMILVAVTLLVLIVFLVPHYGRSHVIVCVSVCSLAGSLTVMSVKTIGIAIKLTFDGDNQFFHSHTWVFVAVVLICGLTQLNYLNKALDAFDTAVVSLTYYLMFTSFTILASVIMFKNWQGQAASNIISEICGFLIILSGVTLLITTKDIRNHELFRISAQTQFFSSIRKQLLEENKNSHDSSRPICV